jgi:probable rRNA maturation factor
MAERDPGRRRRLQVSVTDATGRTVAVVGLARWLSAVAPARACGSVSIAIVSDERMRCLNRQFAGTDRVTDVLAFAVRSSRPATRPLPRGTPSWPRGMTPVGDIAIARGVAGREARMGGHPIATEFRLLALHGLLHLLGYDHHADRGTMARLERRLRRKGGLQEGLIERSTPA